MAKENEKNHLCLPEDGEAHPGSRRQLSLNFRKGAKLKVITCKIEGMVVGGLVPRSPGSQPPMAAQHGACRGGP